jgi:hypothetical protein
VKYPAQQVGRFAYGFGPRFDGGMPWTIPNLLLHDKPVPLANMRTLGRNRVLVCCSNPDCQHNAEIDASGFPDDVTFWDLQPECFAPCAIIAALMSARQHHGCDDMSEAMTCGKALQLAWGW